MEEFVKIPFPHLSGKFKDIRFRLYDIEKSLGLRIRSWKLTGQGKAGVYVIIVNDCADEAELHDITRAVVDEGASAIAYHDRLSNDSVYFKNAEKIMDSCSGAEVITVLGNRPDIAIILGADGVCLDSDGIPAEACRCLAGEGFLIGYTISELSEF